MHIISVTDFPLFCSYFAWKCLILPAECSPPKSLILLEILPAEFIQAYYVLYDGLASHPGRGLVLSHPCSKAKHWQERKFPVFTSS